MIAKIPCIHNCTCYNCDGIGCTMCKFTGNHCEWYDTYYKQKLEETRELGEETGNWKYYEEVVKIPYK